MPQRILYFDYQILTEELIEKGIPRANIFYYRDTPHAFEFQKVLNTWQTFMSYYEDELGIEPARVYFTNNRDVNAKAGQKHGYYLIEMNSGVIVEASRFFESKEDRLSGENLRELLAPGVKFSHSIGSLMRDFSVRFFFDHEFGHIVQKAVSGDNLIEEEYQANPTGGIDVLESHLKEFDADYRGSIGLASVVIDYWTNLSSDCKDESSLNLLTTMGIASVLCSFSDLLKLDIDFYLKEFKHPHPLVRINYIIHFLQQIFCSQENLKIDWAAVLNNAIFLSTEGFISDNSKFNSAFYEMNNMHYKEIIDYINMDLKRNLSLVPFLGIHNSMAFQNVEMDELKLVELQFDKLSKYTKLNINDLKLHFPSSS